jgi:hypothetical protein
MKNKASFSLGINGSTQYITPNAFTYIPGYGQFSEPLPIKQPSDNLGFNGLFDYALTRDQTLRVSVNHNSGSSDNLGIGGNDSIERAYSNNSSFTGVRIQEAGPLGRRFFMNTRLMIGLTSNDQASEVESVTYRVVDARTTGGAQIRGGRHGTTFKPAVTSITCAEFTSSDRHQRRRGSLLSSGRRVQLSGHICLTVRTAFRQGTP